MALVSYRISDSSEDEDEKNGVHQRKSASQPTIHSSILPPKNWSILNNISFHERDRPRPVRILAPTLRQDVEEPQKKTIKSAVGCDLVTLLPEPKLWENASFRPFDKNKNCNENGVDSSLLDSGQRHSKESSNSLPSFFFTPSTEGMKESRFDHESEETSDNNMGYDIHGGSSNTDPGMHISGAIMQTVDDGISCFAPSNGVHRIWRPSSSLSADDLVKLCGPKGRHLSSKEISLIEIDGANSAELNMNNIKSLTYDYNALYRQHKFKSSRRERTKHQITYLVEHAKLFERKVTSYPRNSMISQKRYGF